MQRIQKSVGQKSICNQKHDGAPGDRKGNCWDNAVAESFFKTLKAECVYQNKFINKQHAAVIVFEYIEIWRPPLRYNRERLHSALGYVSPKEFEELLNKQKIAA